MKQLFALGLLSLLSSVSLAADLSLSGNARVGTNDSTTKADVLAPGAAMVGISAGSKDLGASKSLIDSSTEKRSLQTGSAFVGYGVAKSMQLSVLATGTKDIKADNTEEKSSMKFSSAKAAFAVQLLDQAGFAATLEPFVNVGSGANSDQISFSRSSKSNGGANILLGYGAKGTGSLDLALNYLSLGNDKIGDLILVDEKSADLGLSIRFAQAVGITTGVRHSFLQVRSEEKTRTITDRRAYASLNLFPGLAEVSVYGAVGIDKDSTSEKSQEFGIRLAYVIGKSETAPKTSFANEKGKTEKPQSLQNWEPKTGTNPNPDYVIPGIDPNEREISGAAYIKDDQSDDFRAVEQSIKEREALRAKGPSDDEIVDKELNQLRDAEKRVEAEKAKKEAAEEELRLREARENAGANAKKRAAMERNANEKVKRMKGITDDELNWQGLE